MRCLFQLRVVLLVFVSFFCFDNNIYLMYINNDSECYKNNKNRVFSSQSLFYAECMSILYLKANSFFVHWRR